ncbi:MAG: UvrD-helicase domain-containing protein, partial [Lachnospiraceae bacterium]|nr:UvrD-helicase domain-containing protein [Lachnospiraceae bacterium]
MADYNSLNPSQLEAVKTTEGPLLILAGAGSGKTRVITYRVAYLIEECNVRPWNIMAITFTNKAAAEMKERVNRLCGTDQGSNIWVATFHSSCARILRRHIQELGLGITGDYTIYDTDDQKSLIRRILKTLNMDPKVYKEAEMLSRISKAKEQNMTPEKMSEYGSFKDQQIARVYRAYQDQMIGNNALDFDDLLMYTVMLFDKCSDILAYYQDRFQYIMVDEYQDTNMIQFKLIEQLAGGHGNLCVVGDDDQSIYRFRGADIRNILSFEKHFQGAKVIRLEQNYRSTGHILNAANSVIANNTGRKGKNLFTDKGDGEPVRVRIFPSGNDEARAIIRTIEGMAEQGEAYSDFAILYRTNAQSRLLEEACRSYSVPYKIFGGVNFYQRKEIKDLLAYLKLIAGGNDDTAVARIVNVPKRGIGDTTVEKVRNFAEANALSLFEAMGIANQVPGLSKAAANKIQAFCDQMEHVRNRYLYGSEDQKQLPHLVTDLITEVRYQEDIEENYDENEAEGRRENIDEFLSTAMEFEEKWKSGEAFASFDTELGDVMEDTPQFKLLKFLEEVALIADIDRMDESSSYVSMMTIHGAKGLEFPYVFLCGMEEGLFPSQMALRESEDSVEEERRLCYVGITRAEKILFLTAARMRTLRGETSFNSLSRFMEELPEKDVDWE